MLEIVQSIKQERFANRRIHSQSRQGTGICFEQITLLQSGNIHCCCSPDGMQLRDNPGCEIGEEDLPHEIPPDLRW